MLKKIKLFIVAGFFSVSMISFMGSTSFANNIEGTERVIKQGEGEVSIGPEVRSGGGVNSPYRSTLSMGNQYIEGKARYYPAGAHSILMTLKERTNNKSGLPNYCKVTLQRSKSGGYSRVGSEVVNLRNEGATYVSRNPRQQKGYFRYIFDNRASTIGNWNYVDYFYANPVKMYAK